MNLPPIYYGAQAGNVWSPGMLPGLFMWLRADIGTVSNGSGVTNWRDLSGAGNSVSGQAGVLNAADPQYNNQATIAFVNASANRLNIGSITGCTGQPMTSIIVGHSSNSATEGTFQNGTSATMSAGFFSDTTGNIYMSPGTQADTNVSGLKPCIMAMIGNGANSMGFVNNSQTPVVTWNGGTNSFNGQGMQIGAGGVAALDGKIAEVICCNGLLGPGFMKLVFTYLGSRYAIGGVS